VTPWRRLRRRLRLPVLRASAWLWRRLMLRTTVVAITGSVGKTTTKECLAAILAARAPTLATRHNQNDETGVPRTLLRLRPWHRFAVIELGSAGPGQMRPNARLVRPDVALVLAVASTHTDAFETLDATAADKAELPAALRPRGLAILNRDDERVRRMAERCRCRVETFGRSPAADVWADEVSARWPERLTLRVHAGAETRRIETRLVGEQWVNGILAALLAARALGVAPAEAAAALERVEPFTARMQPVRLPNGAVVIRDEQSSSPDTWRVALGLLREASARRRVLVASDLSDVRKKPRVRYRMLGDHAADSADVALFVGEHARFAVRRALERGMDPTCVHGVLDVRAAAEHLARLLEPGDVALLKGRGTHHLSRALFAQLGEIGCWKTHCRRHIACDVCPELRPAFDLRAALAGVGSPPARGTFPPSWRCGTGSSRPS
jgi:UDP-N-acetylmuramoyl-tripeptide--D-alanyl-D-alanine ligase